MSLKTLSIITVIIFLIILALFGVLFFISRQPPKGAGTELQPLAPVTGEEKPKEEPKKAKQEEKK